MNEEQSENKATDKLHTPDLGETKDFNNLNFDEESNSFEIDVKGEDKDYDHPLPYDTAAPNGEDDNSDYDEANPYIGDEYKTKEEQVEKGLENSAMHIDNGEILEVSPEDEYLARTPEDDRTDLDEEGYPINDAPPMP
ncbi:hypothetical protein [Pedobacter metabolipauper]|nr:hypothetical protein [Pedobacter metabolipauper]